MNAAGSIGANSPERFRLLVMTWETPALTSPSAGDPGTKFVIAIGVGATLPSGTVNLVWARAKRGSSSDAVAPAPPIRSRRRSRGIGGSGNGVTVIAGLFKY